MIYFIICDQLSSIMAQHVNILFFFTLIMQYPFSTANVSAVHQFTYNFAVIQQLDFIIISRAVKSMIRF